MEPKGLILLLLLLHNENGAEIKFPNLLENSYFIKSGKSQKITEMKQTPLARKWEDPCSDLCHRCILFFTLKLNCFLRCIIYNSVPCYIARPYSFLTIVQIIVANTCFKPPPNLSNASETFAPVPNDHQHPAPSAFEPRFTGTSHLSI